MVASPSDRVVFEPKHLIAMLVDPAHSLPGPMPGSRTGLWRVEGQHGAAALLEAAREAIGLISFFVPTPESVRDIRGSR